MWITARDLRVCGNCAALDGQVAPDDAYFHLPGGYLVEGPFHFGCRCRIFLLPRYDVNAPPAPGSLVVHWPPPTIAGLSFGLWLDFMESFYPPMDEATAKRKRQEMLLRLQGMADAAVAMAAQPLKKRIEHIEYTPGHSIPGSLGDPESPPSQPIPGSLSATQRITQGLRIKK